MSKVTNNSGKQENSVLAQTSAVSVAVVEPPTAVEVVKAAAEPSPQKAEEASATSIPVINNSAKGEASSVAVDADDGAAASTAAKTSSDKAATEKTIAVSPKAKADKKTPAKRTPSKRMSFIERAQKESEELVKNLGGSLELDGGRRTRSSTRGTPTRSAVVATPPPAKKARSSPAASSSSVATTPSRRGRGRKIDTSAEPESAETDSAATKEENKKAETVEETLSEDQQQAAAAADNNDSEKSSVENAENSVVDAANSAAAAEEAEETAKNAKKQEEDKVVATVDKEKSGDKTDDPIPEEKQNNIDHNLKEQKSNESPIDTIEDPEALVASKIKPTLAAANESITLSPTKIAETANIEKLPTPEPMEVDSVNFKDTIGVKSSATDIVECMEEDITETDTLPKVAAETVLPQLAAEATNAVTAQGEKGAVVMDTNSVKAIVNDLKSVAPPEIVDVSASGEPRATQASQVTNATSETTNEHKSESDFSEPKIVSPPTTDDSVTATPQYCN